MISSLAWISSFLRLPRSSSSSCSANSAEAKGMTDQSPRRDLKPSRSSRAVSRIAAFFSLPTSRFFTCQIRYRTWQ